MREWKRLRPTERAKVAARAAGLPLRERAVYRGAVELATHGGRLTASVQTLADDVGLTQHKSVRRIVENLIAGFWIIRTRQSRGGTRVDGPNPTSTYQVYLPATPWEAERTTLKKRREALTGGAAHRLPLSRRGV